MKNNYHQKIRGICAVLVIAIHCLVEPENELLKYSVIILRKIINFAVPVFIYLAGYYSNIKKCYKMYVSEKIKRILLPYVLWNIIYTLLFMIVNNDFSIISNIHYLYDGTRISHMYYLLVVFVLYLLTPLLQKIANENNFSKYTIFLIPIFFNILYITIGCIENNAFELQKYNIFHWIGYYYLGIMTRKNKVKYQKNKINKIVIVFLVLSIIEGILIYSEGKEFQLAVSQCGIFNYFYSIVLILAFNLCEQVQNKNIFSEIGNISYAIYLSHFLILLAVQKIISLFIKEYITSVILTFIITITITTFICKIYYNMKWKYYNEEKN